MRKELSNIFDLNPSSRVLVEASAGTGKTYTIVGIFVRLLLERELEIDQILAVTFTKKATAELRERILERLRECLETIESSDPPAGGEPFLQEFHNRYGNSPDAASRLRRAIHNFDDSQVFTIHGFCQKVLQEEALIAGTPFEMNVSPTDQLLITAAEDFWRLFMHEHSSSDAGRYMISKLTSIAESPEDLIGRDGIKPLLDKRYSTPEGDFLDDPVSHLQTHIDIKKNLKDLWDSEQESIREIMKNSDVSRYAQHMDSRIEKFETYLADNTFSSDKPESFEYLTSEYFYDPDNLKKNGKPPPRHEFFDLCSRLMQNTEEIKKVESTLLLIAYKEIGALRKKLTEESEIVSYNDLLVNTCRALLRNDYGSELAEKLLKRYPIALVDEFQDTDPIQYEIFDAIYSRLDSESSLMMIGDPKQAIYAFRGADLHTYFRAKNDGIGSEYTLMKNYRSTVGYIHAVNRLFEGDRQPFIEDEISYTASKPGRVDHTDSLILDGKEQPSLSILAGSGVEGNKNRACDFAFSKTVKKIGEILELASKGKAFIGDKPVRAGDIAILVSRHKDANNLKRKLKSIGIDAVTKTNQTIFETLEANKIEMLMNAVLNPVNSKATNAMLLTGLFGLDLEQVYRLTEDEEQYQELTDELQELQELWYRRGFYAMFYEAFHRDDRLTNFAALGGAERVITNLYHLAELCAQEERDSGLGPRLLHRWLRRQMEETEREEEKELQLESDQHLVKIMTVHASKGLQFPLVFCPTLWMGKIPDSHKSKAKSPVEYHKPGENDLYINIEREKSDRRTEAEYRSDLESVAEEVRKTYVALTRAKIGSFVSWHTHSESHFSGLGAALLGKEKTGNFIENKVKIKEDGDPDDSTFIDIFGRLAEDKHIRFELADESGSADVIEIQHTAGDGEYKLKTYNGRGELPIQKRMESFSSLAGHVSEPGDPDYDQVIERYTEALNPEEPLEQSNGLTLFRFPGGAAAGTAIHKLFEHEEFDFTAIGSKDFSEQIKNVLTEHRFDEKWTHVLQSMMRDVASSAIPGLKLAKLKNEDQIRELEFQFPSAEVQTNQLLDAIRNQPKTSEKKAPAGMFLTGFIDLVARQNGKYFIIDYKSNYLGDSFEDYSRADLEREIRSNSYDLQYHIYTVALVKYLRTRIPNFDYNEHFGGAAYLFVRGMKAGSDNGIWFHKPDRSVIENLEKLLDEKTFESSSE